MVRFLYKDGVIIMIRALLIEAQIKANIKAPRYWPLWGEFTGDRWIPSQRASKAGNVSIWWRHHDINTLFTRIIIPMIQIRWLWSRLILIILYMWDDVFILEHHKHNESLTHWGRVTHICVSKVTIIGSDNGLSPGRRQDIMWTNAGIMSIVP